MRRFFVEEIEARDGSCLIVGPEARHISKVLRMKPDDKFILMDGNGVRFLASIKTVSPQEVRVALVKPLSAPPPSPVQIILCQALLKSRKMDYLIQKTSELGVNKFLPFLSERTVANLRKDRADNKLRHWHEIANSSATQSDRTTPAQIGPLSSFRKLVGGWKEEGTLKVILWEEEGAKDLKAVLRESGPGKTVVGIVGPEGGFSKEEIRTARDAGFISVSLGRRILRAETAAVTLIAILQYEWGDLSLSKL